MGQTVEVAMTLAQISATLFVAIVFSVGRSTIKEPLFRRVVAVLKILGGLGSLYLTFAFVRSFLGNQTVATPVIAIVGVTVLVGCCAIVAEWFVLLASDAFAPEKKKRKSRR